jgi:serine/threonine protein phosphatase PrpC
VSLNDEHSAAEEEARLKAKSDERARSIAAEQISAAAEVKDDFEDGDTVAPKESGSTSGVAMALAGKGATPPSDLQATLKDKKFKEKVRGYSARFSAGYADTIGKRPTMEDKLVIFGQFGARADADYFAVFDGHGGADAAAFAGKSLHKYLQDALEARKWASDVASVTAACTDALAACQRAIEADGVEGGTTALLVLVLQKQLFVANLGDCRAVLITRDGKGERASYDHKPTDPIEEARIVAAGGHVTRVAANGVTTGRVNGMLAVARSLGDNSLRQYLTAQPQVHGPFDVAAYQGLIVACDGVWDVVSDNTAARLAAAAIAKNNDVEQAAIQVRNKAFTRLSKDNISVLVVNLAK